MPRREPPDSFVLAPSLQRVPEPLPYTRRVVLWLNLSYCLLLIPPWQKVKRDIWEKCRSSTTHSSCTGCRSTGMGGRASSGMIPSSMLSSFSFLICSTVVPSCSGSCIMSFSRKVSHVVLASVLMAVFLRTKWFCFLLHAIWQSTASDFSSLSYEQVFSCYSKYWLVFKGFCYYTYS